MRSVHKFILITWDICNMPKSQCIQLPACGAKQWYLIHVSGCHITKQSMSYTFTHYEASSVSRAHGTMNFELMLINVYWLLSGCLLQRGSQFHNNSWKFVIVVKLKTWKNFRASIGCAKGIVKNNDFCVQWAHGSLKALEKKPFRSHGFWQMESKYQTFRTLK